MQNTSIAFKEAAASRMRELVTKLTLTIGTNTYELGASDIIGGSLNVTHACMGSDFSLGSVIASDCSISLNNNDERWNNTEFTGATIQPYSGFKTANGNEFVLMGTFIVDASGKPSKSVSLKASDKLILLDKPFDYVTLAFPATNAQILTAIGLACNVPILPSTLSATNMSYVVDKRPDVELSCRDIVGQIALMAYGFARMTRTGQLEIVKLPQVKSSYSGQRITQTTENRFSFKETSDPIGITGIKYGNFFIIGDLTHVITIAPLDILQSNANMILSGLLLYFIGTVFRGYSSTSPCDPSIDAGDVVEHITREGKTILSIVGQHRFIHGGLSTLTVNIKSNNQNSYRAPYEKRLASIAADTRETINKLSDYQLGSAHMSELLGLMMGTYRTEEVLEDGSIIYYFHDQQSLAESQNIWKFNGQVFGFSSDSGATWGGISIDSNLVVKAIQTTRISAEMIDMHGQSITHYIDQKANIFSTMPQPPYTVGDVWAEPPRTIAQISEYGNISHLFSLSLTMRDIVGGFVYVCKTERLTGSFNHTDWKLASVDDQIENVIASRVTVNEQRLDQLGLTISSTSTLVNQQGEYLGIAQQDITTIKAGQASFVTKSGLAEPSYTTINGGNITTGLLRSTNGYTQINLNDGTFSLANGNLSWNNTILIVKGELKAEQAGRIAHVRNGQYMIFNGTDEILNISNYVYPYDHANIILGHGGKALNIGKSTAVGSINYYFMTFDGIENKIIIRRPTTISSTLNVTGGADIGRLKYVQYDTGAGFRDVNSNLALIVDNARVVIINTTTGATVKTLYP